MDTNAVATIVLLGGFVVLLALRVPVSFSLVIATVLSALVAGEKMTLLMRNMVLGVNNFSLLSIPFFILAGEIMGIGGISKRLIAFSNLCVGWMRGGLAMVNVMASMLFGGISGSAVADVSSLGTVLIPMMKKQGYDDDFAVGITVTSACQGVLIPPSHNMVIFALVCSAPVSIGGLFMGGMIPGILLGIALMVVSYILAVKRKYPKGEPIPRGHQWKVVMEAILPLFTIVIIIGGVTLGIFTATESAAIACVYAFIITFFVIREVKITIMGKVLKNTLKTLAIVLTLIAAAKAFSIMMTTLRIPENITAVLIGITTNRYLLLLIINALLLFLGCIMDMAPLILIMTPILEPVLVGTLGLSPIHFGVMLIFNLAIGLCTPPVGSALFVGCAIGKTPIERTSRHMMPMYLTMVVMLLLITFVPEIVMWIPNMLG